MPHGKVVCLCRPVVSQETVAALQQLLLEAQSGQLIGIAFITAHPGGEYSTGVIGAARRNPMPVRIMFRELEDRLVESVSPA